MIRVGLLTMFWFLKTKKKKNKTKQKKKKKKKKKQFFFFFEKEATNIISWNRQREKNIGERAHPLNTPTNF